MTRAVALFTCGERGGELSTRRQRGWRGRGPRPARPHSVRVAAASDAGAKDAGPGGDAGGVSAYRCPAVTRSCPHPRPAQAFWLLPQLQHEHWPGWPIPRPRRCRVQAEPPRAVPASAPPVPSPRPTQPAGRRRLRRSPGRSCKHPRAPAWLCRTTLSGRHGSSPGHRCAPPGRPSPGSARPGTLASRIPSLAGDPQGAASRQADPDPAACLDEMKASGAGQRGGTAGTGALRSIRPPRAQEDGEGVRSGAPLSSLQSPGRPRGWHGAAGWARLLCNRVKCSQSLGPLPPLPPRAGGLSRLLPAPSDGLPGGAHACSRAAMGVARAHQASLPWACGTGAAPKAPPAPALPRRGQGGGGARTRRHGTSTLI